MPEERNELWCHNCERYVQFTLDTDLNGNHEIECPSCGHIHYRFVENGKVTDIRYRSSYPTYQVSYTVSSSASYMTMTSSGDSHCAESWSYYYSSDATGSWG